MAGQAPLGYPTLPDAQRLSSTRPVFGGDLSLLASALNHLAGVKFRQVWSGFVESRADTVQTYDGVGVAAPVSSVSHTVWVFVQPTTLARHLFVRVYYMAEDESTTEPIITAALVTDAGVTEDIGVRWRRSDGTLGTGGPRTGIWLTSGVAVDDELAGEASPSKPPRMLTVTAACRGVDCWVTLTTQEARILSYTIAEFAEESVE